MKRTLRRARIAFTTSSWAFARIAAARLCALTALGTWGSRKRHPHTFYIAAMPCCAHTWLTSCLRHLGCHVHWMHTFCDARPWSCPPADGIEHLPDFPSLGPRVDVRFSASHDAPLPFGRHKTLAMTRDPRDVAWSMYNYFILHHNLSVSFEHYVTRIAYRWNAYYRVCLATPGLKLVRFEDYKRDEFLCLKEILEFCELNFSPEEIAWAVENSSFAKAAAVERAQRASNSPSTGPMLRSGQPGQWRNLPEYAAEFALIGKITREVRLALGYRDLSESPLTTDLNKSLRAPSVELEKHG